MQLDIFTRYPSNPGFKKHGTSQEAAEAVAPRARLLRDKVLSALKRTAMTADEVATYLDESVLSVRPRLSELSKKGLIIETGERRKNESGKAAAVWRGLC